MNAMHRLADILIGRRSDGASIQDNQLRLGRAGGRAEPLSKQGCFQRRAIGLRSPAPEIVNMEALQGILFL